MGLWILSETIRWWERDGEAVDLQRLLAQAAAVPAPEHIFDANDAVFGPPGDMPGRIAEWLTSRGFRAPSSRAEFARCILESLAQAFADAVHEAGSLASQEVRRIHIVGGGSLNELLCQRTADLSGLTVIAGPVEATAIGNVLVQGRALDAIGGSLESLRGLVARTFKPRVFTPKGH